MMDDKEGILTNIGDSVKTLAKFAAKNIKLGEAKPQAPGSDADTGFYYNKRSGAGGKETLPGLGEAPLSLSVEFFESQRAGRDQLGLIRNLTLSAAERAFVDGCRLLLLNREQEALVKFSDSIQKDPQMADGYFVLGALQLDSGNFPEAIRHLETLRICQANLRNKIKKYLPSFRVTIPLTPHTTFSIFPDPLGMNVLLALAKYMNGEGDQAVRILEQAEQVFAGDRAIWFMLAFLYTLTGQEGQIVARFQEIKNEDNTTAACLILLGRACARQGDPASAARALKLVAGSEDRDRSLVSQAENAAAGLEGLPSVSGMSGLAPTLPPSPLPQNLPPLGAATGQLALVDLGDGSRIGISQPVTFGREEGDVILGHDPSVSRVHARVFLENNQLLLEDLRSTNGTYVNNHRISGKVILHRGDIVQIGQSQYRVE